MVAIFLYGKAADGALFEDVASQQKSFVSVLVGVAIDKGLIDVDKPVSDYLGVGWSKATPDQEKQIRVINVPQMNSGLDEKFACVAPAGPHFSYRTAAQASSQRILTAERKTLPAKPTPHSRQPPAPITAPACQQRPAAY